MKKIFLPVIAISLGILAFCQLENTFKLVQEDAWQKFVGKEVGYSFVGAKRSGTGTLLDLDQDQLTIKLSHNGMEVSYNREHMLLLFEPEETATEASSKDSLGEQQKFNEKAKNEWPEEKLDDSKSSKFALVTTGVASFWDVCKKGGEAAGKELGVDVEVLMPSSGYDQNSKLEDLLAKGVDGIAVAAIDPINQASLFDEVARNSILVTMDTDAPTSKREVYVGMDNYEAGWMCGELVKEAIPDGGEVVLFIGRLEQDNAKRRRQGVIDCLLGRDKDATRFDAPGQPQVGENYTVLATVNDQFDRAKGKANVKDMLTKHEGVDAMVGLFSYNPPLILEALKQAGKIGEVKVIGFDEDEFTLQGIKNGLVHGTVVQNPFEYGKRSIEILHALSKGDTSGIPENKFVDIPARQIRKDNLDAFWSDLNSKLSKKKQ